MTAQTDHAWIDTLSSAEVARIDIPGLGEDAAVATYRAAITSRPTWTMTYDWTRGAPPPGVVLRVIAAIADDRSDLERSPAAQNLGAYVQEVREARNVSRQEFARRAGLDVVALSLAERGLLTSEECSDTLVSRLASGLGMPMSHMRSVMDPALETDDPPQPISLLVADLWALIKQALAPAPAPVWGVPLGSSAPSAAPHDAPEWALGTRDSIIEVPMPLPAFEVGHGADDRVRVVVLPEIRPVDGLEVGYATLHLRLAVAGVPVVGRDVSLQVGELTFAGRSDTDGCVAFPRVAIRSLLDTVAAAGAWPVTLPA